MRHVVVGMILGVCGQIGLWGIGYWTPELIRGSQIEERRELAMTQGFVSENATDGKDSLSMRELAEQVAPHPNDVTALESQWRLSDDRLVAWSTVLQDTAGMCGIYAFTFFTVRVGRRIAFAVSYPIGLYCDGHHL